MAQEFKVQTFIWSPGMKKKEYFFDTLSEAVGFADENAPDYHVIKVWNDQGKNVHSTNSIKTRAEDPQGLHMAPMLEAKIEPKGQPNPRTAHIRAAKLEALMAAKAAAMANNDPALPE